MCCYQAITSDVGSRRCDAEWLQHILNTLYPADSSDYDSENQLVTSLMTRYQQLLPAIETTTLRSFVVIRCHEYKVVVERQVQWLTEMEERMREDVPLDDVDSVNALLYEQEVSCLQFVA